MNHQADDEEPALHESGDNLSGDNLNELKLRGRIAPLTLDFFDTLPSTNRYLMEKFRHSRSLDSPLVVARMQTAGRGRREKLWESAAGNVAMTFGFSVPLSLSTIGGYLPRLSIIAAAKVADAIHTVTKLKDVQIKWPNDLVLNDRKLGGLLIETSPCERSTMVAIGLGLNVNTAISLTPGIDQLLPNSLIENLGRPTDLNELVGAIVDRWREFENSFEKHLDSFDGFAVGLWRLGDIVLVSQGPDECRGQLLGVNRLGSLELKTANGGIKSFPNGTLRVI